MGDSRSIDGSDCKPAGPMDSQVDTVPTRAELAEAESMAKSQFLANLSHELRTPLNGLLGMVELMQRASSKDDLNRYASFARRCGEMMEELVNDILEFSKNESQKISIKTRCFSPREICADVEHLMHPLATAKGLWFQTTLADKLPNHLRGDAGRLRQVLLNLTSNAIKFTDKGEVRLSVDGTTTSEGLCNLICRVDDTGPGIAPFDQQRVFQAYTKVGQGTSAKGTGLGLAICKQIIEQLGGEIGLESLPEMGSRFWFGLKLEIVD